ncbi:hypothetical protein [Bifidobacterium xylocopae]|uniref:Uncharacterized protein n=1 Tax=Bifidobacterium xylocopae TaxID=2493119 RepID=A0A366KD60_9BIFI|nr:hypothetical protein [Bifidobacterium xylocopae]RBP99509.1 hypothetical protein CRD59_02980 [Bifidobacterium xylocopae]
MKKFFHDLSWAQVFAGALAAVTSFFLSAKIGIAGSAIGVAVGSIVSAVASQIYKNVLDASTHQIQKTVIGPDGREETIGTDDADLDDAAEGDGGTTVLPPPDGQKMLVGGTGGQTVASGHTAVGAGHANGAELSETAAIPALDMGDKTRTMPAVKGGASDGIGRKIRSARSGPAGVGESTGRTGGRSTGHLLRESQQQRKKRMVIIVSVVSALVAVILSALVINAVTKGEGTDHVVRDIVRPSQTVQTPAPDSTDPEPKTGQSPRTSVTPQHQETPTEGPTQVPESTGRGNTDASPTPQPSQSGQPTQTASPTPSPTGGQSTPGPSPSSSTGGNAAKVPDHSRIQ